MRRINWGIVVWMQPSQLSCRRRCSACLRSCVAHLIEVCAFNAIRQRTNIEHEWICRWLLEIGSDLKIWTVPRRGGDCQIIPLCKYFLLGVDCRFRLPWNSFYQYRAQEAYAHLRSLWKLRKMYLQYFVWVEEEYSLSHLEAVSQSAGEKFLQMFDDAPEPAQNRPQFASQPAFKKSHKSSNSGSLPKGDDRVIESIIVSPKR